MGDKGKQAVYWLLITTFALLYLFIAFVSFLHAVEFFGLANNKLLSIMLAISFEIGQSAILFSLLLTQNKHRLLAWSMMILLTTLQVTANVFASFKFMDLAIAAGNIDWTYWQRSILFWMDVSSPEMYKVIISWIIGALLPIVSLGMTALVADNIKMMSGDVDLVDDDYNEDDYEYINETGDTPDGEEGPNQGPFDEPDITSKEENVDGQPTEDDQKAWAKLTNDEKDATIKSNDNNYWLKDPDNITSKEEANDVFKNIDHKDIIALESEKYNEPIVNDKDQIRIKFDEEPQLDTDTDHNEEDHSDFDDIREKGIDEIIEESNYDEPDDLGKK